MFDIGTHFDASNWRESRAVPRTTMPKHTAGHHKHRVRIDTDRAFERGVRDRARGVPYSQCPYSDKDLVFQWEAGWATQNAAIKTEGTA